MISVTITRNGEQLDEIIFDDNVPYEGSTSGVYRDVVRNCRDAALWQTVAHIAQIVATRGNLPRASEIDPRGEANLHNAHSAPSKGADVPVLSGEALQQDAGDRTVTVENHLDGLKSDREESDRKGYERWRMLGPDGGRHPRAAPRVVCKDSDGNERTIILLGASWRHALPKRGS